MSVDFFWLGAKIIHDYGNSFTSLLACFASKSLAAFTLKKVAPFTPK
ncbi:MAG TPA: hypothetical protein PLW31_01810 [Bacteroidales bacterium]|nr:hypothetical protein [Bacteroidales bacterium]